MMFWIPYVIVVLLCVVAVMCAIASVRIDQTARHCPDCDYDLRGHRGERHRCPECGRLMPRRLAGRIIRQPRLFMISLSIFLGMGVLAFIFVLMLSW